MCILLKLMLPEMKLPTPEIKKPKSLTLKVSRQRTKTRRLFLLSLGVWWRFWLLRLGEFHIWIEDAGSSCESSYFIFSVVADLQVYIFVGSFIYCRSFRGKLFLFNFEGKVMPVQNMQGCSNICCYNSVILQNKEFLNDWE